MLAYTTYSEAGGVGKSTCAANLAVAHARAGLDVLAIPLDPQDGDLSRLFDVDQKRDDEQADNIVRHLIDQPKGSFDELIETREGVDIIPEHNMLSQLGDYLREKQRRVEANGGTYEPRKQLLRVLRQADVHETYDVLICDPPATEGPHLHNAIYATRTLLIPIEPSAKGQASIEGLENLVRGLSKELSIEIGVIGTIPNGYKDTRDQQEAIESIAYTTLETIRERSSLFEGAWAKQCSAFKYVREHRDRVRDYEVNTLKKFDRVARTIEQQSNISTPSPPEPGQLVEVPVA
jgi:cellulose biosynthesis protein BcsQ